MGRAPTPHLGMSTHPLLRPEEVAEALAVSKVTVYRLARSGELASVRIRGQWTLRRPHRRLSYDAARAMFNRANAALGSNWSLHDLRHTAAYRMARDPSVPLTDVQWVLGHAHLSTTQRYLNTQAHDVIEAMLAFYAKGPKPPLAPEHGYRPESLEVLFGKDP